MFIPPNEPFMCSVHPGGYRLGLDDTRCRAAEAEAVEPMDAEEIAEFDRWAESRRGKGVSLGMLWALRLRATLADGGTPPMGDGNTQHPDTSG